MERGLCSWVDVRWTLGVITSASKLVARSIAKTTEAKNEIVSWQSMALLSFSQTPSFKNKW
eukprot:6214515-Pleurochrysis_carterae.AAC.3